jgi:alkanesulfonate monooxygenase SsuD/methylene tetrahydromethanopterin reductase-like flavin-dependent oxidoreductase (luciferase family)
MWPMVKIGMFIPRGVGDPRRFGPPSLKSIVRYGQRADDLGFDSLFVPDHFFIERPKGTLVPYPEAWTTMTALVSATKRIRVGSMVLAAGFRHPALLAKMAGALQELADGRLILGVGTGNQPIEHETFGLGFEGRAGRFAEYLAILTALLKNEHVTLHGKHYRVDDAWLRMDSPAVPIWIAATGDRTIGLAARYAAGWNGGGANTVDGEPFVSHLAKLRGACRTIGRDPSELEISSFTTAIVSPDERHAAGVVAALGEINGGQSEESLRRQYVLGTPEQVVAALRQQVRWGVTHFIISHGPQPSTLWSDETLELFGREVLPALKEEAR